MSLALSDSRNVQPCFHIWDDPHWQTSFPGGWLNHQPVMFYVFCAQTWQRMQSTRALHCQWSLQLLLDIVLDQSAEHEVWISNRWSTMTYYVFTMFTNIFIISHLHVYSKLHCIYIIFISQFWDQMQPGTQHFCTRRRDPSVWLETLKTFLQTNQLHLLFSHQLRMFHTHTYIYIYTHMYVPCVNIQIE